MQNLNELNALIASFINSIFGALADKKLTMSDIALFLDPILKAAPAIEDIKEVGHENAALTVTQRNQVSADFLRTLTNVDESTADDLTRIMGGILAAYRVGYNLGKDKGATELTEKLRSGEVALSDLIDEE